MRIRISSWLVSIENINQGRFIAQSKTIRDINITVVDMLRRILDRGVSEGIFRPGLDAVDVHMLISSISIFRVANRHTFGTLFHNDMNDAAPAREAPGLHGRCGAPDVGADDADVS